MAKSINTYPRTYRIMAFVPGSPDVFKDRPERETPEYKAWRFSVLARDQWKCQHPHPHNCGGGLEVHHIVPWSKNEQLRYVQSNGITLCKNQHDDILGKEDQLEEVYKHIVQKRAIQYHARSTTKKEKFGRPKWKKRNPNNRIF